MPQVYVSVWVPTEFNLTADDLVLNRVLPSNAAPVPAGCASQYQSTSLHLYATWSNGEDAISDLDVTSLATFVSDDPTALQVTGSTAQVRTVGLPCH